MTGETEQFDRVCKKEFRSLGEKIDNLDTAIRGDVDGKAGLITRVDRLEQLTKALCGAMWIVAASFIAGVVGLFWQLFTVNK